MGLDARIKYTKKVIKDTFIDLLKKKPLNKITVKEICDISEINRATFYKYYYDTYNLMEKLEEDIILKMTTRIKELHNQGFKKMFTFILENLKENSDYYLTLFSENGDSHFPARIMDLCYKEIETLTDYKFKKLTVLQQQYLYDFIASGCGGIIKCWVSNGMKDNIEEVVFFANELYLKLAK